MNQYTTKKYTDGEIKSIIREYDNGVSLSKIANNFRRNKNNIKQILIDSGVWVDIRGKSGINFTDKQISDIKKLYGGGLGLQKIANKYDISKTPIKRIVNDSGVLRKGTSNGQKITLTETQKSKIMELYLNEYLSSKEIAIEMGLTEPFINKYLGTVDYRRSKGEAASIGLVKRYSGMNYDDFLNCRGEYKSYKSEVSKVTNRQPIEFLYGFDKRGVSGIEGAYHLDHKFSILEGFKQDIEPEFIGNINNLEFIPWRENIDKRISCSISKTELLNIN